MATQKWSAGTLSGWVQLSAAADLSGLANNSAVFLSNTAPGVAAGVIPNSTSNDVFANISFNSTGTSFAGTTAGGGLGVFLYPLNGGSGTIYGDNQFPTPGSQLAKTPSGLWVATIPIVNVSQVQSGSTGSFKIDRNDFGVAIQNLTGGTLPTSSNLMVYIETTNLAQ
jgi:hypothetical protein